MPSVLITGANGFVGFHTVKVLLDRGYDVVGTVRSESKTTYLRNAFKTDKLSFAIVPDIATPGAFDQVLKENKFDAVLHTSSPFVFNVKDVEADYYKPAIEGTVGILKSIAQYGPTVKRVVVTSSFTAVGTHSLNPRPGYVYSEADWNPMTWEEGTANVLDGYYTSKKLAEEAAWDFVKKENPHFSLTTLCPPYVFGPPEQEISSLANLNTSAAIMYQLFNGAGAIENGEYIWVDVRDLALAHVLAIEKEAAAGQRYLLTAGRYSTQEFVDYIWKHYPERAAAKNVLKGDPSNIFAEDAAYTADNSKSKRDLGLDYITLDKMMEDTFKRFVELEAKFA